MEKKSKSNRYATHCICAIVLAYCVYIVIDRWNGIPARPDALISAISLSIPIDPETDRTNELIAAIASIPPTPPITFPTPPQGYQFGPPSTMGGLLDAAEALNGKWTPATRPNLYSVIAYLESPATSNALDQFLAIERGTCQFAPTTMGQVRSAVKLLCARARYHHAERGDVDAALTDLGAVLRLSTLLSTTGETTNILTALACRGIASEELRCMAHEHPFTKAQSIKAREIVLSEMPDMFSSWAVVFAGQGDSLSRLLDAAYTDDGRGNGWLVLSRFDELSTATAASGSRSGAWNSLSVFFNDRRTVAAKIRRIRQAIGNAGELPYIDARSAIDAIAEESCHFTILDGPLASIKFHTHLTTLHRLIVREQACRTAFGAVFALSAYHHDHERYPDSIEQLLGTYLDVIPMDVYDGRAIRYRALSNGDDYLLYAVGPDGTDDGGAVERGRSTNATPPPSDIIWGHERRAPYSEPELKKVNP